MPSLVAIAQVLMRAPQLKCTLRLFAGKNPREEEIAAVQQLLPRLSRVGSVELYGANRRLTVECRSTGGWRLTVDG
jgi:hypothetical protein